MMQAEDPRPEGDKTPAADGEMPAESEAMQRVVRMFVEHWGGMARAWGINATMGEIFALLYITGTDWTADDLKHRLRISRGNVSMNLRELIAWGVVHKVHRQGERREYYHAESDVWTLFRRILAERKRRELDPTIALLERTSALVEGEPGLERHRLRVNQLLQFFTMIDRLAGRLSKLDPEELHEIQALLTGAADGLPEDS